VAVQNEARVNARKILRCPARLTLADGTALRGRTFDVSMGGLSIMMDNPLPLGTHCTIAFEALTGGKTVKINVAARVIHCALSGTDGFRIGVQLERNDEAAARAMRQLLT